MAVCARGCSAFSAPLAGRAAAIATGCAGPATFRSAARFSRAALPAGQRRGHEHRCFMAGALAGVPVALAWSRRGVRLRLRRSSVVVAAAAEAATRAARDGDPVLVNYTVKLEDGTVADSNIDGKPLSFTLGQGKVIKGLEEAVRGLSVGDRCEVTLPPEMAYGERQEKLVMEVPAEQVPKGLEKGMSVSLQSGGRNLPARVVDLRADGSAQIDLNHVLAGETLQLDLTLTGFRELLAPTEAPEGMQLATFAAGCFWGVELAFQRVPGVLTTSVGYAQGEKQAPTYEDICTGQTGHTEAVRVVFDPTSCSFEDLLKVFWERVGKNATTLNVAGNDRGTQYRSGIYFHSDEQKQLAEKSALELQMRLGEAVVTEVMPASPFWMAEDYHQQYLEKGGGSGQAQSAEKGCTETIRCYG